MSDIPVMLYKFRNWKNEYHKRIITHNEVRFASPSEFNDPFDRGIPMRYDLETAEDYRRLIEKHLDSFEPTLSPEDRRSRIADSIQTKLSDNPNYRREITEKYTSKHGIFSMAATRTNPLLWSHYSSKHQGFCVGYDSEELKDFFERLCTTRKIVIYPTRVEYRRDYPVLMPSKMENEKMFFNESIRYKSEDWKYEQEYRFIYFNGAKKPLQLENYLMKEVILGCEMSPEYSNELLQAIDAKSSNIKVYRAVRTHDSFEVDFEPV